MPMSIAALRTSLLVEVEAAVTPLIAVLRSTSSVLPVLASAEHKRRAAIQERLAEIRCETEGIAIADELWKRIKDLTGRRSLAVETNRLLDAIDADEAQLVKLDAEKQLLLRELQPHASAIFANDLAALVRIPAIVNSDSTRW